MYGYVNDIFTKNAFGTYRKVLEDVTYSAAMAKYLAYRRNPKADPETGSMPDENFAREIMQLFSIGLVELNMDGTPKLDAQGKPIETYDNDDIFELAKVFTGFGLESSAKAPWQARNRAGEPENVLNDFYEPMVIYAKDHSTAQKAFLDVIIPADTSGDESVQIALDALVEHPNTAPFISRQLIQRFTASHPEPAYVARVARAFRTGRFIAPNGEVFGSGQNSDLEATIAAILLDSKAHQNINRLSPTEGKIREPLLRFAHWAHSFNIDKVDSDEVALLSDTNDPATHLAQHPLKASSVFNFYRPGYVAPGTESGDMGLTTPEFQATNGSSALGYANFMTTFIFNDIKPRYAKAGTPLFVPNYKGAMAVADDAEALLDRLDLVLTAQRLTEKERQKIGEIISMVEITNRNNEEDRATRVKLAILLITSTATFGLIQ